MLCGRSVKAGLKRTTLGDRGCGDAAGTTRSHGGTFHHVGVFIENTAGRLSDLYEPFKDYWEGCSVIGMIVPALLCNIPKFLHLRRHILGNTRAAPVVNLDQHLRIVSNVFEGHLPRENLRHVNETGRNDRVQVVS